MSKIDTNKIIELYSSGLSAREVASILTYGASTVKRVVKAAGINRPSLEGKRISGQKRSRKIDKDFLIKEYVEKCRSIKDIALELKISSLQLSRRFNLFGIEKRKGTRKGFKNELTKKQIFSVGDICKGIEILKITNQENRIYHCKCHCGLEFDIEHTELKRISSCGCLIYKNGQKHHLWKGVGQVSATYLTKLHKRAAEKGLEFNLDCEYCNSLLESQKNICAISGIRISLDKFNKTASIDRIDPSLGYVRGNVHWVHKKVNQMKWDFSLSEFLDWCRQIVRNVDGQQF